MGRSPRPAALGWKLETGQVPAADLDALRASVQSLLMNAGPALREWPASESLRALLAEYHAIQRGAGGRESKRAPRGVPLTQPADRA